MDIGEETRARIAAYTDGDFYESPDHVLQAALGLLDEYEATNAEDLARMRKMMRDARDSGPGRVLDDTFLEEIKAEGRRRALARAAERA